MIYWNDFVVKAKCAGMSPVVTFHFRKPSGEKQYSVPGVT